MGFVRWLFGGNRNNDANQVNATLNVLKSQLISFCNEMASYLTRINAANDTFAWGITAGYGNRGKLVSVAMGLTNKISNEGINMHDRITAARQLGMEIRGFSFAPDAPMSGRQRKRLYQLPSLMMNNLNMQLTYLNQISQMQKKRAS